MTLDDLRAAGQPALAERSDVFLAPDPFISLLVDSVSEQNLIGYVQTLESFGTRNTFSDTESETFGIGAARRWIFSEFERVGNGRLQVEYQDYSFSFQDQFTEQRNIVATLPGAADRPEVIVLMANYDTRPEDWLDGESLAPGADDNASGVAALLEIARLMSAETWPNTIVFAAFTAEEQGTFGSRDFVRRIFFQDQVVHAALNNDMVGGRAGIPQHVRLYSIGPDTSAPRHLARYIDLMSELYVPDLPVRHVDGLDREGRWGDQREFVFAGFPAVRFIESEEDLAIQNSIRDRWNLIDYSYLRRVTQLNLAAVANMAGSLPVPPAPTVSVRPGEGGVEIAWQVLSGASAYAVMVRPRAAALDEPLPIFLVSAIEAGRLPVSNLTPGAEYAVSLATVDTSGRLSRFSAETIFTAPGN